MARLFFLIKFIVPLFAPFVLTLKFDSHVPILIELASVVLIYIFELPERVVEPTETLPVAGSVLEE